MKRTAIVLFWALFLYTSIVSAVEPPGSGERNWILKKGRPDAVLQTFKSSPQSNVGHIRFKWDERVSANYFLATVDIRGGIAVFYNRGLDGETPAPLEDYYIMEIRWKCAEGWCVWVNDLGFPLSPFLYQRKQFAPQAENAPF